MKWHNYLRVLQASPHKMKQLTTICCLHTWEWLNTSAMNGQPSQHNIFYSC